MPRGESLCPNSPDKTHPCSVQSHYTSLELSQGELKGEEKIRSEKPVLGLTFLWKMLFQLEKIESRLSEGRREERLEQPCLTRQGKKREKRYVAWMS